ncbi:MAG: phosphoribosyl-AMP cyclohydrolase [Pseudomonadota bacterium]|nr:phosphoribosyl-AMP cyclohydrolase [Pseudomonadota bacterium]
MTDARDTGLTLNPKYDRDGLITAVVTDDASREVLMVAHMNAQALALTVDTGLAHFWSRSRQALWKKGETSGHMLQVRDIRIDCDQDAVWVKAVPAGPTCHTGARSCFFRRIGPDGLSSVDAAG